MPPLESNYAKYKIFGKFHVIKGASIPTSDRGPDLQYDKTLDKYL